MTLTQKFDKALLYASRVHAGQERKGSGATENRRPIPYFAHVLQVAAIALEYGADEDEAIAALLHDAVEDAGGRERLEDIRTRFGVRVAEIVAACSDTLEKDYERNAGEWRARKERYIAHIAKTSDSARLVSAADKLANLRSIIQDYREVGDALWKRFRTGRKEDQLWYYRSVADALLKRRAAPLVAELSRRVDELESLVS